MDWLGPALPILFGVAVTISALAQRRLAGRSPAAVWLAGLPVALMPVVMILAGVSLLSTTALLAGPFILGGVVFLAVWGVYTKRSVARVRAAQGDSDITAAIDEPFAEMSVLWAGVLLLGGFVAVGLIIVVALVTTR